MTTKTKEKAYDKKVDIDNLLTKVESYLETRLAIRLLDYSVVPKIDNRGDRVIAEYPALSDKDMGIFRFALKECRLVLDMFLRRDEETKKLLGANITVKLRYAHYDGGTNGCDLGFRLNANKVFSGWELVEIPGR